MTLIRHIVARGRVQGVGYRAFVEDTALRFGLEGWVRNRRDGTVEAVVSGDDDLVERIIAACRRGPPAARVEAVDVAAVDAGSLRGRRPGERFSVLATA